MLIDARAIEIIHSGWTRHKRYGEVEQGMKRRYVAELMCAPALSQVSFNREFKASERL